MIPSAGFESPEPHYAWAMASSARTRLELCYARIERSNVLIYFDGKSKTRTVQHFFNALLPNGYFFLGHSESLYGISDKFRLVHFPGATAYWKPNESAFKGGVA